MDDNNPIRKANTRKSIDDNYTKMPEIKIVHKGNIDQILLERKNLQTQDGSGPRSHYRENMTRIDEHVRLDDDEMKKYYNVTYFGKKNNSRNAKTTIDNYFIDKKNESSRERGK